MANEHVAMIVKVETEKLNTSVPSATNICAWNMLSSSANIVFVIIISILLLFYTVFSFVCSLFAKSY